MDTNPLKPRETLNLKGKEEKGEDGREREDSRVHDDDQEVKWRSRTAHGFKSIVDALQAGAGDRGGVQQYFC